MAPFLQLILRINFRSWGGGGGGTLGVRVNFLEMYVSRCDSESVREILWKELNYNRGLSLCLLNIPL